MYVAKVKLASACCLQPRKMHAVALRAYFLCLLIPARPLGRQWLLWPPLSETPDKACGTEVENLTSPRVAGMENNTPLSQA